jgi:hypothetical protein
VALDSAESTHYTMAMKQQFWATLALSTLIALAISCQKEKPPEPAPAPPAPAPVAQAKPAPPPAPAKPAAKPLEWDDPPQWKKVPPSSPMRTASYEIPAAKGDKDAGELNVFVLGGDVEANIQRWVDEFSDMPLKSVMRSERSVNDMRQAVVEVPKGKFSGGMGDKGARDNYALLGAIVVAPSGAEYFFKLTGPSATVKAAKAPFYALLDGIREQGGTPEKKPSAAPGAKPAAKAAAQKPAANPAGAVASPQPAAKP